MYNVKLVTAVRTFFCLKHPIYFITKTISLLSSSVHVSLIINFKTEFKKAKWYTYVPVCINKFQSVHTYSLLKGCTCISNHSLYMYMEEKSNSSFKCILLRDETPCHQLLNIFNLTWLIFFNTHVCVSIHCSDVQFNLNSCTNVSKCSVKVIGCLW